MGVNGDGLRDNNLGSKSGSVEQRASTNGILNVRSGAVNQDGGAEPLA